MADEMIVRDASTHPASRGARRRSALPAFASALIAGVLGLGASTASATERVSSRTQALPAANDASSAGPPRASASAARDAGASGDPASKLIELRAARRFSMVGLRWASAAASIEGELRAQRNDGSWTTWMELEAQQGPDGVVRGADGREARDGERRAARQGLLGSTEPLWTGPAARLQVRLTGPRPSGLRAAFVDVRAARVRPVARAAATARQDANGFAGIQPRTAWDPEGKCAPRTDPSIGSVQAVVVHHTVGTNSYSQDQVPSVLLGICTFHRNGNGWNDIGYNILVDRFGGAWEGRAGGLTQAVVGAQAQGFNAVTAGIAMLGDFQQQAPTAAQLATVSRVAAWRLAVAGVARTGTVALTSAGGSLSRFDEEQVATLPRVVGHRDVGLTECPGAGAYGQLDGVRTAVAAANPVLPITLPAAPAPAPVPVKITIATQRKLAAGAQLVVKGAARQGAAPLRSATLALQVGAGDRWQTVAKARTSSSGRYQFARRFSRSWNVRVVRTDGDGGTSSSVAVGLVPRLRLSVPRRLPLNKRTVLRGSITPGRGPVRLTVERRTKSGRYVAGQTLTAKQSGRRLTIAITPHTATLYRFRLAVAASEFNTAARSSLVFGRAVVSRSSGGTAVVG